MKAVVQNAYGGPEVLELKEINRPIVEQDRFLVRVHAASLHAGDYFIMRGAPYMARFYAGWPRPKDYIVGLSFAGRVEEVGENGGQFSPGDHVFGECQGACAEIASVPEHTAARMPSNLTFAEAAAVPTSALAALRGLRDAGRLGAGQSVLINGASGGVGTFAVQIAKFLGAKVTGVCSTRNADLVRSIGADHVIDYTQEDFTRGAERYDLILDNVGNRSFSEYRRVLSPEGRLLSNSGHAGMGYFLMAFVRSIFTAQQAWPLLSEANADEDLRFLQDLIEAGEVEPVVDRRYPLAETPAALAYIGERHARAKVVVLIDE